MTIRSCALIAWSSSSLLGCDPSLSGYDLPRPHDAGADVSLDRSAPSIGPGYTDGSGGASSARADASSTPPSGHEGRDAKAPPDARAEDAASDATVCTLGVQSNAAFAVASAEEIGLLETPPGVYFRDGAASGMFGQTPIWLFHDTDWVSDAGAHEQLPATAGFGDVSNPTTVSYGLDTMGAPLPLLSLTPEEKALNEVDGGAYQSFFLWPNGFAVDGETGYVFYAFGLRRATLQFDYLGTGVARLTSGKLVATRDPAPLFAADEPKFDLGAVIAAGFLYLYACDEGDDPVERCYVARAPEGGWADRKQYEFWDGCAWTAALPRRAEVMTGVPNEMTVSYNRYLKAYLAVYTANGTVNGKALNDVVFRTAPRPEGPWSEPVPAFTQIRPDGNGFNYGAKEHPEFASESGKAVLVTYPRNRTVFTDEVHLVKVRFQ